MSRIVYKTEFQKSLSDRNIYQTGKVYILRLTEV